MEVLKLFKQFFFDQSQHTLRLLRNQIHSGITFKSNACIDTLSTPNHETKNEQRIMQPIPNQIFTDVNQSWSWRVTYNSMGEPVKSKIKLDQKVTQQKPRCTQKQHLYSPKQSNFKRSDMAYSFMDLTRTIHVLREILLGKISRDIMYSRSCDDYPLADMLRFYCQTSFGTIAIAENRQTDLFTAMLALHHTSPFIRTMRRLLHLPDIQPLAKKIEIIYFQAWSWFLKHDALSFGQLEVHHHNLIHCDMNMKLKRFLISGEHFVECLRDIQNVSDTIFSPYLLDSLMNKIKTLHVYEPSSNQNVCLNYLDVDEVLEATLTILEENDIETAKVHDQLFGEHVTFNKVLTPTSKQSLQNKKVVNYDTSIFASLLDVQIIFHQCIESDQAREGLVQYMRFKQIIRDWYNRANRLDKFVHSQYKSMFELFKVDDDKVAAASYIEFVGVIYTILLDEQLIPYMDEILIYFSEPRRGIELQHIRLLKEYVLKASYMKMNSLSSDHKDVKKMTPTKDRHAVRESRRTISKIESYPNHSDFIARWLTTGSLRNEYQNAERKPPTSPTRNERDQPWATRQKPKTPLNLIQPQPSFDNTNVEDITHLP